jgi:hypothetical protein
VLHQLAPLAAQLLLQQVQGRMALQWAVLLLQVQLGHSPQVLGVAVRLMVLQDCLGHNLQLSPSHLSLASHLLLCHQHCLEQQVAQGLPSQQTPLLL